MRELTVGDRIDQYELTELLARGGMASVFKAVDLESGAPAALKIPYLQYECDVVFFERFRREEEILQRLDHPNIVRVFRPPDKSRMYIAMEYVEGLGLAALMRAAQPMPIPTALDIARQTCQALAYLHSRGIVHRDVKPENIVVTPSGQVKLLDFGIATASAVRRLTWAGLSKKLGTPDYMAPEQIRGRRGDARTDVYALGTMLYEMLTGKLPYQSENTTALLRMKASDPPRPPSCHVPGFDPALEAIILKALAPSPGKRYAGAAELLRALEDPASEAPRDCALDRSPRRGRLSGRRRIALALVVSAVVSGLGSLVWLTHLSIR